MTGWDRLTGRFSQIFRSNHSYPLRDKESKKRDSVAPVTSSPTQLLPAISLEPFPKFPDLEPDSPVITARTKLHEAAESLETVLQEITSSPSSTFLPDLGRQLNDANGDRRVQTVVINLLSHQHARESSNSRRIGDFLAKLYPVTKLALNLTSSVSSVASFAPLEVTANGLSQVLKLAMDPRSQSKEIEDALGELNRNQQFVRRLQKLSTASLDETIVTSGIEYLCAVMEFLRVSLLYLKKDYFVRFVNGVVGIQDVAKAIEVLKDALRTMDTVVDRVVNLAILQQEDATERKLALLTISSLDSNAIHGGICERRLAKTGQWVLREDAFSTWRDSTSNSEILWCSGLPGVGKTFIASVIVDHLIAMYREKNVGIVFFYLIYSRQNEQTTLSVVLTLAKQLIEQKSELLDIAKAFAKELRSKSPLFVTTNALENGLAFLKKTMEPFDKIFIVFDALDEYSNDHEERIAMAELLKSLLISPGCTKVSLCITSRKLADIWAVLQKGTLQKTDLGRQAYEAQEIEILPIAEDITRLINDRIDKSTRVKAWCEEVATLRDDIVYTILQKSDRIFMLANLQLTRVLCQISLGLLQRTLRNLSNEMDELYAEAMTRIESKIGEERDAVIKLLTVLFYAEKPLDVLAVQHAMAAEEEILTLKDIESYSVSANLIASWSEGLIIISGKDSVRFAHETVQTFFMSQPGFLLPGHEYLLRLCIATLSTEDCFHSVVADTMSQDSVQKDATIRVRGVLGMRYKFSWYAINYWAHHLERLGNTALPAYVAIFMDRLQSPSSGKLQAWQWCSSKGWTRACQALIERGADVNKTSPRTGWSALHRASFLGFAREHMVEFLVAQPNIDISLRDKAGRTVLTYASSQGNSVMLQLLLQGDVKNAINAADTDWGWTPLSLAAANGHVDCVKLLLSHKLIDVNIGDKKGRTALIHAAQRGRAATVQALLSVGPAKSDISLRDAEGRTALSHAAAASNPTGLKVDYEHVVKMLLLCDDICVLQEDDGGHSPLWWARQGESEHHKSIVKALEEYESTAAGA